MPEPHWTRLGAREWTSGSWSLKALGYAPSLRAVQRHGPQDLLGLGAEFGRLGTFCALVEDWPAEVQRSQRHRHSNKCYGDDGDK